MGIYDKLITILMVPLLQMALEPPFFFEQGFIFIDSGTGEKGGDYLLHEPVKNSVFLIETAVNIS